jgi:ABC-type Mn2+/Zn2+ transport system ATPase subunit
VSAPLIEFKRASIGYGGAPVLTGVDLSVEAGDFWGVLGHNGSGKSTLLKTALGLIPVQKGGLERRGSRLGLPAFGYVPQKERLDPLYPLTAGDVAAMGAWRKVELFARLRGKDGVELAKRALHDCGASQLVHRRFSDLSGGQKQRVLIARALAAEPELLVLDEPLAGIDVTTQRALLDLLKDLKSRLKLTVMMVSHRVSAEKGLFTKIAWVDEGKVESGPAEKLLSHGRLAELFRSEP